jgi:hypothetical protein
MKYPLFTVFMSLFSFLFCDMSLALEQIKTGEKIAAAPEKDIPKELREQAEFSCIKYAGVRLQDEVALRIIQVKAPDEDDSEKIWVVVGNKINNENEDRPISFSCRLKNNGLPLWDLQELSLFQVTEDSVNQMKELQMKQNSKNEGGH